MPTESFPLLRCSTQEAWIENLTEVLALASHARGRVIQPAAVEDFILFITICLSSPAYIKNPYLR